MTTLRVHCWLKLNALWLFGGVGKFEGDQHGKPLTLKLGSIELDSTCSSNVHFSRCALALDVATSPGVWTHTHTHSHYPHLLISVIKGLVHSCQSSWELENHSHITRTFVLVQKTRTLISVLEKKEAPCTLSWLRRSGRLRKLQRPKSVLQPLPCLGSIASSS